MTGCRVFKVPGLKSWQSDRSVLLGASVAGPGPVPKSYRWLINQVTAYTDRQTMRKLEQQICNEFLYWNGYPVKILRNK